MVVALEAVQIQCSEKLGTWLHQNVLNVRKQLQRRSNRTTCWPPQLPASAQDSNEQNLVHTDWFRAVLCHLLQQCVTTPLQTVDLTWANANGFHLDERQTQSTLFL